MPAVGKLTAVSIDCPDPAALADFYREAAGMDVIYSDEHAVYLSDGTVRVGFLRVDGYVPPTWPSQEVPQQMHFDIAVDDIVTARASLEALGATTASEQPGGDDWVVMLDPAGHSFCVTTAY